MLPSSRRRMPSNQCTLPLTLVALNSHRPAAAARTQKINEEARAFLHVWPQRPFSGLNLAPAWAHLRSSDRHPIVESR